MAAAVRIRLQAHAPYSGFAVGAALLDSSGRVHLGCNVENASYGLSICAERNAVAAAVAAGADEFAALVVVPDARPPASPCGACRQVLAEFGDMPVVLAHLEGEQVRTRVSDLLPLAFTPDDLRRS